MFKKSHILVTVNLKTNFCSHMYKKSHNLISLKNNENLGTGNFLYKTVEYLIKIFIELKPFIIEG